MYSKPREPTVVVDVAPNGAEQDRLALLNMAKGGTNLELAGYELEDLFSRDNSPVAATNEPNTFKHIAEEGKVPDIIIDNTPREGVATNVASQEKPIITASNSLEKHDKMLQDMWSKASLGLCQKRLPELDDRLLGMRLFMLLAAAPNVGKTALAIQLSVDMLEENADAALLFVTLEMSTNEILSRVRCMLAEIDFRKLMKGSFTKEEQTRLDMASDTLKLMNYRFEFIDSTHYRNLTPKTLKAKIDDIKKRTGSKHVMVVIDYLQVLPIPDDVIKKYHSNETALERWRIEALKELSDYLNGDPLLVISEARKPSGQGKWAGSMADIMGSARCAYGPDVIFLYAPLSDEELNDKWEEFLKNDFEKITGHSKTKDSSADGARIREFYDRNNMAIGCLNLDKGRDGMRKGLMFLRYNFEQNIFVQLSWIDEATNISKLVQGEPKNPNSVLNGFENMQNKDKEAATKPSVVPDNAQSKFLAATADSTSSKGHGARKHG